MSSGAVLGEVFSAISSDAARSSSLPMAVAEDDGVVVVARRSPESECVVGRDGCPVSCSRPVERSIAFWCLVSDVSSAPETMSSMSLGVAEDEVAVMTGPPPAEIEGTVECGGWVVSRSLSLGVAEDGAIVIAGRRSPEPEGVLGRGGGTVPCSCSLEHSVMLSCLVIVNICKC